MTIADTHTTLFRDSIMELLKNIENKNSEKLINRRKAVGL